MQNNLRLAHFSDHYKMASPIALLQNEGARPPIEALFSEARKSLACFKLQAGP